MHLSPAASQYPRSPDLPLLPGVISALQARIEHLLLRPIVADISAGSTRNPTPSAEPGEEFLAILDAATAGRAHAPGRPARSGWSENEDGTWSLAVEIDYDDQWRGYEREVRQAVKGALDGPIVLLTGAQRQILMTSPREFLRLHPRPEAVELVGFKVERIGGSERITALTVAERPERWDQLHHVAVVPNLVPLERQLAAARLLDGPDVPAELTGLLVLLGLAEAEELPEGAERVEILPLPGEQLDRHQRGCVSAALTTPHFAAIQGPPGSGKTTFLAAILRREIERGSSVLVVSPTNVAVDNVVEKLAPTVPEAADDLPDVTTPLRYAPKVSKLLPTASDYWVGPKKQRRAGTIARRLERTLRAKLPLAHDLYDAHDPDLAGTAPLSAALADAPQVLCGTPIGLLSHSAVKEAAPGAFDLLIIDEVSKLTLPEFLAIAIKARRWVLVGDPQQLPPYVDAEEAGATLDDLLPPPIEAACSVGAILDRAPPAKRSGVRVVVVAADPDATSAVLDAHLRAVGMAGDGTIEVASPSEVDEVIDRVAGAWRMHRGHAPEHRGSVDVLLERGVTLPRPLAGSGARLVEGRHRAGAELFGVGNQVLHAQPWSERSGIELRSIGMRKMLPKVVPSAEALRAYADYHGLSWEHAAADDLERAISLRFAIGSLSIYDWLVGLRDAAFDVPPLRLLPALLRHGDALRGAVRPYFGTLRSQYRMAPSLSAVPRDLFYFGDALHDGAPGADTQCVRLVPVVPDPEDRTRCERVGRRHDVESNPTEVDMVVTLFMEFARMATPGSSETIMVITPYRAQEREMGAALEEARASGRLGDLDVEVCTLDRCQGREADHVFISLVRSRSTPFLDAPKRWNVALTRAMKSLWIVGDVESYLREAREARQQALPPRMSLLARTLEAYDRAGRRHPRS